MNSDFEKVFEEIYYLLKYFNAKRVNDLHSQYLSLEDKINKTHN